MVLTFKSISLSLATVLCFVSSPANSQTWNWEAQCKSGAASGWFKIESKFANNFKGTLAHNSIRDDIRGSISGDAIYFSRYIDDHKPTRTQTWEGYYTSSTQITGGTLHDPVYGNCTWTATSSN